MIGLRRLTTTVVVASAFALLGAASASAAAVYNLSESGAPSPYEVRFVCGSFCAAKWEIPAGGSAAYPGMAGVFANKQVGGFTREPPGVCARTGSDTWAGLEAHGWAELHYQLIQGRLAYRWSIFGSDGTPVAGSPFPLVFFYVKSASVFGCPTPPDG